MIVLADNDILLKFARCDLFDKFMSAFSLVAEDIRILKTARFSVSSKKHRSRIGEPSYSRLTAFLERVADIDIEPDPTTIAALSEQTDKNIDAGEAALFAICPRMPNAIIATGDKKSLVGLVTAGQVDATCAKLCGALEDRILCFEHALERILNHFGFESIRQKLIEGRECDRGLALWLGSGLQATEESFREGLQSYLDELRRSAGALLMK